MLLRHRSGRLGVLDARVHAAHEALVLGRRLGAGLDRVPVRARRMSLAVPSPAMRPRSSQMPRCRWPRRRRGRARRTPASCRWRARRACGRGTAAGTRRRRPPAPRRRAGCRARGTRRRRTRAASACRSSRTSPAGRSRPRSRRTRRSRRSARAISRRVSPSSVPYKHDVLAPGELGVDARTHLDQRTDAGPARRRCPRTGTSRPSRIFSSVDLPDPLSPTRPTDSPGSRRRSSRRASAHCHSSSRPPNRSRSRSTSA